MGPGTALQLRGASRVAGGGTERQAVGSCPHLVNQVFARLPSPSPCLPLLSPVLYRILPPPRSEQYVPIDEAHPLKAVSPYGATKLMIEDILRDVSASDPEWRIILLRYFNPVGAHPSGGCRVLGVGRVQGGHGWGGGVGWGARERMAVNSVGWRSLGALVGQACIGPCEPASQPASPSHHQQRPLCPCPLPFPHPPLPAGRIGEHQVMLNNLMPWVQAVALGHRPVLQVYGTDYDTRDGTCVRDYIHVMDLGEGHVAAVKKVLATPDIRCVPYNLGTGTGTTVLEMVHAFEKASGLKVNCNLTDRRPGDAQAVWAATETAEKELG